MKYTPKNLKRAALGALSGKWLLMLSCYCVYTLLTSLLSAMITSKSEIKLYIDPSTADLSQYMKLFIFIIAANLIFSIILSPFRVGFLRCTLNTSRNTSADIRQVFAKPDMWPSIMLASFIKQILIVICGAVTFILLTMTPIYEGISLVIGAALIAIVSIEFIFVDMILADNSVSTAVEAIKKSHLLLKGHRWHIINMIVSFILWFFLCLFALTIGLMFLEIYFFMTLAVLYNRINEDIRINVSA